MALSDSSRQRGIPPVPWPRTWNRGRSCATGQAGFILAAGQMGKIVRLSIAYDSDARCTPHAPNSSVVAAAARLLAAVSRGWCVCSKGTGSIVGRVSQSFPTVHGTTLDMGVASRLQRSFPTLGTGQPWLQESWNFGQASLARPHFARSRLAHRGYRGLAGPCQDTNMLAFAALLNKLLLSCVFLKLVHDS
jgi:hypothetical protein